MGALNLAQLSFEHCCPAQKIDFENPFKNLAWKEKEKEKETETKTERDREKLPI